MGTYHGYQPKIAFFLQIRLDLGATPTSGVRDRLDQETFANSKFDSDVIGAQLRESTFGVGE